MGFLLKHTARKHSVEHTLKRRDRRALLEMKKRVRRHERDQEELVKQRGDRYRPRIYVIKPRDQKRRDYCKQWLAEAQFKYVELCWDPSDFEQGEVREIAVKSHERQKERLYRGWDPLVHARGPLCHTEAWPWPLLPPFLVADVLDSYASERAREALENDLNISRENRFRVEEFLQAAGLDQEFFKHSKANALPRLPVNVPLFALGMQSALGVASATAGVDN